MTQLLQIFSLKTFSSFYFQHNLIWPWENLPQRAHRSRQQKTRNDCTTEKPFIFGKLFTENPTGDPSVLVDMFGTENATKIVSHENQSSANSMIMGPNKRHFLNLNGFYLNLNLQSKSLISKNFDSFGSELLIDFLRSYWLTSLLYLSLFRLSHLHNATIKHASTAIANVDIFLLRFFAHSRDFSNIRFRDVSYLITTHNTICYCLFRFVFSFLFSRVLTNYRR